MHGNCCCNPTCMGMKKLLFGGLLLLNAFVWPKWLGIDGWVAFIAVLVAICGLIMMICPACKTNATCPSPAVKKATRRKRRR